MVQIVNIIIVMEYRMVMTQLAQVTAHVLNLIIVIVLVVILQKIVVYQYAIRFLQMIQGYVLEMALVFLQIIATACLVLQMALVHFLFVLASINLILKYALAEANVMLQILVFAIQGTMVAVVNCSIATAFHLEILALFVPVMVTVQCIIHVTVQRIGMEILATLPSVMVFFQTMPLFVVCQVVNVLLQILASVILAIVVLIAQILAVKQIQLMVIGLV